MKTRKLLLALLPLAAGAASCPAAAAEVFGGLYVHDVKTPLNLSGIEDGMDVMVGWRGGRIGSTPLQPYVFGALNTAGDTSYAAAGVSARFGERIFIRPGLGLAIHTGSAGDFHRTDRVAFGSRILLQPELGVGARISDRASIEAHWVHMSHGTLLSGQNPGMDNIGVRVNVDF